MDCRNRKQELEATDRAVKFHVTAIGGNIRRPNFVSHTAYKERSQSEKRAVPTNQIIRNGGHSGVNSDAAAAASKMPEAVIEQGRRNRGNAKGSGDISPPASGPGRRAG